MLSSLTVRHFRCFDAYAAEFGPGLNFIVGPNARGKTSLLEAVCILLRLQSPRVSRLAHVIRHGRRGFVVDGYLRVPDSKEPRRMQFYFGRERKKLALDGVEQGTAQEYLQMGRVMWFANTDMEIARGSGDVRRRFLDFLGSQRDLRYRQALRDFERAVRSRNLLLKQSPPRWREIEAFEEPLIAAGDTLMEIRVGMIAELQPLAAEAHETISGGREALEITYVPSGKDNLAQTIASARENDARLRQTTVGPHRDELAFTLNGIPASYASEGQQRTIVLSLKLGAARLLQAKFGTPPLLLLDDIFGELDVARRQALLAALPAGSQKLISTTFLDWAGKDMDARVLQLDAAAS